MIPSIDPHKRVAPEGEESSSKRQRSNGNPADQEISTLAEGLFSNEESVTPPPASSSCHTIQEEPEALYNRSLKLLTGSEIEQNIEEGFKLLKMSAEKMYGPALEKIGECYRLGNFGVKKDEAIGSYYEFLKRGNEIKSRLRDDDDDRICVPEFGDCLFPIGEGFFNPFLTTSPISLTVGAIFRDGSWRNTTKDGFTVISGALRLNIPMTRLDLSYNIINEESVFAISDALASNSTLDKFFWRGIEINEKGVVAFANALKTNSTLTLLDLNYSRIGDSGALEIAKALTSNRSLIHLHLNSNGIGTNGGKAIASALQNNSTLMCLDLSNNNLRDDGVIAISDSLMTNSSLTSLSLSRNTVGIPGAEALSRAISLNSSLASLKFCDNYIGMEGHEAILNALRLNSSLTSLVDSNDYEVFKLTDRNTYNKKQKEITLFGVLFSTVLEGPIYNFEKI